MAGTYLFQLGPPDQIDGLHIDSDLALVPALIDGEGHKHPIVPIEGRLKCRRASILWDRTRDLLRAIFDGIGSVPSHQELWSAGTSYLRDNRVL
jgi:hypothetical protein